MGSAAIEDESVGSAGEVAVVDVVRYSGHTGPSQHCYVGGTDNLKGPSDAAQEWCRPWKHRLKLRLAGAGWTKTAATVGEQWIHCGRSKGLETGDGDLHQTWRCESGGHQRRPIRLIPFREGRCAVECGDLS